MPILTLQVAVLAVNTSKSASVLPSEFGFRLLLLHKGVAAACTWFGPQKEKDSVLRIFVAPEDLFLATGSEARFGLQELMKVETVACYLSSSRNLLLLPGTVAWRKPVDASRDDLDKFKERSLTSVEQDSEIAEYADSFAEAYEAKLKKRGEKISSEEYEANRGARLEGRLDQYGKLEHDYWKKKSQSESWAAYQAGRVKSNLGERFKELAQGSGGFVERNTAPVYHAGRRLLRYHKREGDSISGEDKIIVPGHHEGTFPVLAGGATLSCGVEICSEHTFGSRLLRFSSTGKELHLHFVLSNRTDTLVDSFAVREGGYVIHASSDEKQCGVFNDAGLPLDPAGEAPLSPGKLLFYTCTIEI